MSSGAPAAEETEISIDSQFDRIRDARSRRMDWIELADAIVTIERSPDLKLLHGTKEDFWKNLTELTGYDRNTLQRMTSVLRNLRRIQKEERKTLQEIFAERSAEKDLLARIVENVHKAEFLIRIYRTEPNTAFDLIERMKREKVPVARVREAWGEVLNSHPERRAPDFRVASHAFPGNATKTQRLAELEEHKSLIYGGDNASIYFNRYKFAFVSADAVGICCEDDGGLRFVDGFMILDRPAPKSDSAWENCFASIDYRSRFFRHLWIFAPFEAESALAKISKGIDKLDIPQVGIVKYEGEVGIKVLRRPSNNAKPSRYPMLVQDIMRQGIPDFGAV